MADDITRLYQQCDPGKPLQPGDPRYVPFSEVRGAGDLVARIGNAIRRREEPLHLLFAGHRGGGKSTELLRLQKSLAQKTDATLPFFVVYFEADAEDVDVNDVDFTDLLLAMIRQIAKDMRERLKVDLRPTRFARFWDDFRGLLGSDVNFEKMELDARIAKFTAVIKNSPTERQRIRAELEPHVSGLIQAANELLAEVVTHLKGAHYRDLVLIVDNLDRIVLRDIPGSQFNTHEQLFINRGAQLNSLNCHVVYTLPISMAFSPKATALPNVFGRKPDVLPMAKVCAKDGSDDQAGMLAMWDMVCKRLEAAGVTAETAFDETATLDYLCRMSGGHVRSLLILICSACDWREALPLTRDAVERAVQEVTNGFERALNRPDYFEVLRKIDQKHELPGSEHDQLLMYNLSVLEYLNGESWYAVNPAVRRLQKLAPGKRARAPRKKPG